MCQFSPRDFWLIVWQIRVARSQPLGAIDFARRDPVAPDQEDSRVNAILRVMSRNFYGHIGK